MIAAQLIKYGGEEAIQISKCDMPIAKENEIVVKISAAGVNPFDWKVRSGAYQKIIPVTFPKILGLDFSGIVHEPGNNVTEFKRGDLVYGRVNFMDGCGSFAEYAITEPKWIAPKPKNLSHNEAAALPLAGVSALVALIEHMKLKKGDKILIHGGAGGIGSFAIQIAKYLGATVITTTSGKDIGYVKGFGADDAIDYRKEKFENKVTDIDFVFDTIGGDTFRRSHRVLKKGGLIVSMLEKEDFALSKKFNVKVVTQYTEVTTERLNKLYRFVESGAIKINIDKIFPLTDTSLALSYLEKQSPKGKVVIEIKKL